MSSVHTRHDLAALLGRTGNARIDPRLMVDFVALLAAFGAAADDALRDTIVERLAEGQPSGSVREDLSLRVSSAPDERHLDAWLLAVEEVVLADRGAQRLAEIVRPDLRTELAEVCVELERVNGGQPRSWDCALVAEVSRDELPAFSPWRWIKSRSARGLLRAGKPDDTPLRAWINRTLHADDSDRLRDLVRNDDAWRGAYLEALHLAHRSVYPLHVDATQSVTAAETTDELESAMCLLSIHLPHVADGVLFEARLASAGIWWRWCGTDRPIAQTSEDATEHTWGDDVTGTCRVTIVPPAPSELAIVEDVAVSAQTLASGLKHRRTTSIALAVAEDFVQGRMRTGLERATATFESGIDETQDESRWVAAAVATRIAMSELAVLAEGREIESAFDRADDRLAHTANALMLLNDEAYANLVDDAFVDPDRWWGVREQLARAPTDGELRDSLEAVRRRREAEGAEPSNIVYHPFVRTSTARDRVAEPERWLAAAASNGARTALDELVAVPPHDDALFERRSRAALQALWAAPCAYLDATLRLTLDALAARHPTRGAHLEMIRRALQPLPGTVAVPLVDTRTNDGFLVVVSVQVGTGPRDERVRAIAWEAMTRAHEAVSRRSPSRLPRDRWEDLTVTIDGLPPDADLDGDSLALPLALAIASLWLDRPVPIDLVATGNVREDSGAIGMVEGVHAKAQAVAHAASGTRTRMLVPQASAVTTDVASVNVRGVDSLEEALEIAGLSIDHASYTPRWPDVASLERCIEEDIARVEQQDIRGLGDRGEPWRILAIRLRLAADALTTAPDDEALVAKARVYAALAFQHAGRVDDAMTLLRDAAPIDLPARLLVTRLIVEMCGAIDREAWDDFDRLSICVEPELARCTAKERRQVEGMLLGTRGRALLHRRRSREATAPLHAATEWHAQHLPREAARSRIYLASALRFAGDPDGALQELGRAGRELSQTRGFSLPYAATTETFLRYERARVLVALGHFAEARDEALAARARSAAMGFWPLLGILRVLAWSELALGNDAAHESSVDAMRKLSVPPPHEALRQRLVAIALAGPDADDEVY